MIPINKPWIGDEEKRAVMKVLDEVALTSAASEGGERVREFEGKFKKYLGVRHAIAVNSGTDALEAALLAAGVGPDDEVLIPSFTFVATANAVRAVRARPVFVDINKYDYTMDPNDLMKKITSKTKAIIPVNLYGHVCNFDAIQESVKWSKVVSHNDVVIIEDACQSLGSTFKERQTGTLGMLGCFSMYASKVMTSGEGGVIVTDSDELSEELHMIRNHGMVKGYDTQMLGFNMRLPEMAAAIASVQMDKFEQMLAMRRHNAERLSELLKDIKIAKPSEIYPCKNNWYLYTIQLNNRAQRERVKTELAKEGIGSAVYYDPPVHKTPYYAQWASTLPETEFAAETVLSLPVHPFVTEDDLVKMAQVIKTTID